jgi:hypothetical protein
MIVSLIMLIFLNYVLIFFRDAYTSLYAEEEINSEDQADILASIDRQTANDAKQNAAKVCRHY